MPVKSRLMFAISACLLLSNCGLIGTALRLAPYAMMFADEDGKAGSKTLEMRAREVQDKETRGILPVDDRTGSQVVFKH